MMNSGQRFLPFALLIVLTLARFWQSRNFNVRPRTLPVGRLDSPLLGLSILQIDARIQKQNRGRPRGQHVKDEVRNTLGCPWNRRTRDMFGWDTDLLPGHLVPWLPIGGTFVLLIQL